MPSIKPLGPRESWLGTRMIWHDCKLGQVDAKCALFKFRRARAPWLRQEKLLAVVACHRLYLFKDEVLPQKPLDSSGIIVEVSASNYALSTCDEWSTWPQSESLLQGLVGDELGEFDPPSQVADFILKCWHKQPLPGWQPAHRGNLGISFLRDVEFNQDDNRMICAEVTTTLLRLYNKPLAENIGLKDRDVIKIWQLHDMEPARMCMYLDAEAIVQCRLMMRHCRMWLYGYALTQEAMPF